MIFLNVEMAKFSHSSDSIQVFKGVNVVYPYDSCTYFCREGV